MHSWKVSMFDTCLECWGFLLLRAMTYVNFGVNFRSVNIQISFLRDEGHAFPMLPFNQIMLQLYYFSRSLAYFISNY